MSRRKKNKDVSGKIEQAERYASKFNIEPPLTPAWEISQESPYSWKNSQDTFVVPFVFSTNGRPYFEQLREQSGIWFRDVRKPNNHRRALQQFHSPQGLLDLLQRDTAKADQQLMSEPLAYLNLRDYQQTAIKKIEERLANGQESILVAMATGTGKTRTIIGLIYRLLKQNALNTYVFG